jgi:hypothetical protein
MFAYILYIYRDASIIPLSDLSHEGNLIISLKIITLVNAYCIYPENNLVSWSYMTERRGQINCDFGVFFIDLNGNRILRIAPDVGKRFIGGGIVE